ncbi:MAG: phosphoribosylglycinamide formyltransferase [Flavobacteriales bacterium]|nr:phosphoribosylglycinamide formyltransferase [Flavobacteriales bacterium]
MKIAVLVSGSGTNLQRIIDAIEAKEIVGAEVVQVIADRNCYALERALNYDIPTFIVERGKEMSEELDELLDSDVDLIVMAGFLSILSNEFCSKWENKIINIHPSLLPKYGGMGMWGMNVHKAVLENNEKESGATVHYVTSGVDEGEIILQKSVEISEDETPESLAEKVHSIEYEILIDAIKKLTES